MSLTPEQIRDRGEFLRILADVLTNEFRTPFLPHEMVAAVVDGDQAGIRIRIGNRDVHIGVEGNVLGAGSAIMKNGWRHLKPVPLDDGKATMSLTLLKEVSVPASPDTNDEIDMAIYHDPVSNAVIGLDSSFIEQVLDDGPYQFASPYQTRGPLLGVMIVPPAGKETAEQKEKPHA